MDELVYPIHLDKPAIDAVLPHRGDIAFAESVTVWGPHNFEGVACWSSANANIMGHFPGLPVVPGVLLIEGMAQIAGAGLLTGDPYVRSLSGDLVGVLANVRKCTFKRPVRPDTPVKFVVTCRQMAPLAVQINAQASIEGQEVAQFDILMAYVERAQLMQALQD
jgi:3-hydroxyacyl-[acyl-carrier-protein] dehydratase